MNQHQYDVSTQFLKQLSNEQRLQNLRLVVIYFSSYIKCNEPR